MIGRDLEERWSFRGGRQPVPYDGDPSIFCSQEGGISEREQERERKRGGSAAVCVSQCVCVCVCMWRQASSQCDCKRWSVREAENCLCVCF